MIALEGRSDQLQYHVACVFDSAISPGVDESSRDPQLIAGCAVRVRVLSFVGLGEFSTRCNYNLRLTVMA